MLMPTVLSGQAFCIKQLPGIIGSQDLIPNQPCHSATRLPHMVPGYCHYLISDVALPYVVYRVTHIIEQGLKIYKEEKEVDEICFGERKSIYIVQEHINKLFLPWRWEKIYLCVLA